MAETVAKGYVLIPVHNLSTNWLSGKRQEQKTTAVSRQIELSYKKVATLLRSEIWTAIFLLFVSTNAQFKTKCQSRLAVRVRTGASGNTRCPESHPSWLRS